MKELQASSHGVEGTSHYTASRSEVRAEYVGRRAKDDRGASESIPILGQISYAVERYEEDSGLRGSGDPEVGPHGCNGLTIYSHDTRNHGIEWRGLPCRNEWQGSERIVATTLGP